MENLYKKKHTFTKTRLYHYGNHETKLKIEKTALAHEDSLWPHKPATINATHVSFYRDRFTIKHKQYIIKDKLYPISEIRHTLVTSMDKSYWLSEVLVKTEFTTNYFTLNLDTLKLH